MIRWIPVLLVCLVLVPSAGLHLSAQSPNDECFGAIAVDVGIQSIDTTLATSGTDPR